MFVCLFVLLGLFIVPLSPYFGVWVLVTQYTCEITFIGDPDFVASVPRANEPTSSKVLPPRTYIPRLYFGLPKPFCICIFNI